MVLLLLCCPSLCMHVWGRRHHHAKKQMGKDAFHIISVHCKLNGPGGLSCCLAFEALKRYLGAVWKGFAFFFLFLPSNTNTKLFRLQRTNLTCWHGCSSSFLKDESASTEFPQLGLLLLCIGLKTLTSAVRLIYPTKGVKMSILV